jgi:hypothetical protein
VWILPCTDYAAFLDAEAHVDPKFGLGPDSVPTLFVRRRGSSRPARPFDPASSFAGLLNAVSAGWGQLGQLKEPDFDRLRRRDEFQKLQAGLEKKPAARPEREP